MAASGGAGGHGPKGFQPSSGLKQRDVRSVPHALSPSVTANWRRLMECNQCCKKRCTCCHKTMSWLREFLIGDLPASLSLRTQIRLILQTRRLGTMWMILQVIITIVACAIYVVRTYGMAEVLYRRCEAVFAISVGLDLLVHWYADDSRRYFFFKARTLIDVGSLLPLIIDLCFKSMGRESLGFGLLFVRSLKILKLVRVLRLFRVKKQFASAAAQQVMVVALTVASLLFISASLINIADSLSFGTAIYFTIVTMATVGYGDIGVSSDLARFVVCLVILTSLIWLPLEINKLTQMLALRSRFVTRFTPELEKPNVLLVGHIEATKLRMFLSEFFHPDRRSTHEHGALYQVVILNPEDPSDDVVEVLEDPLVENRVTYIRGTLMNEDDLYRAGAHTALACFILAKWITSDSEAEDAQTVLRTLMLKTFRPSLPCYVQLHHSHNRVQLHMLKKQRVTCIEELKMSILGLSALYPGFTTLLSNLITSSTDPVDETKFSPWMKEYVSGSGKELYSIKLHNAFNGLSFKRAAHDVFTQFQGKVVLLGIEERELKTGVSKDETGRPAYYLRRALLNPGTEYVFEIKPGVQVWAYVLAKNRRTAEKILTLESINKDHLSISPPSATLKRPRRLSEELSAFYTHDVMEDTTRFDGKPDMDDEDSIDGSTFTRKDSDAERPAVDPAGVTLGAGGPGAASEVDLQSPVMPMLFPVLGGTGGSTPGRRRSSSGAKGLEMGALLVEDMDECPHVKDHIVILAASLNSNIDFLLSPLRARYMDGTGYSRHVVILTEGGVRDLLRSPRSGGLTLSSSTPLGTSNSDQRVQSMDLSASGVGVQSSRCSVYVVEGNPHKASDLRRAGLERASACVVLADTASVQAIDEEVVDEFVIHQFLTVEKMQSRLLSQLRDPTLHPSLVPLPRPSPLNYVVEVLSVATLKILDQTYKTFKGKNRARGDGFGSKTSVFRRSIHYLACNAKSVSSTLHHKKAQASNASSVPSLFPPTLSKQASLDSDAPPGCRSAAHSFAKSVHSETSPAVGIASPTRDRSLEFGLHSSSCYPFVTSGSSFLIDLFDVMSCQLFFNSDMLRFVDLMLEVGPQAFAFMHSPDSRQHRPTVSDFGRLNARPGDEKEISSGRLGSIPVPKDAVGMSYGYLFDLLMHDYAAVPIALYRHDAADDVLYVYTGPTPETVLRMSDSVFFLAPLENMAKMLRENPPRPRESRPT